VSTGFERSSVEGVSPGLINPAAMGNSHTAIDKLELAKRLASRINLSKNISLDTKFATQQAAESILKGSSSQLPITAKTVAEQLAAKLNTKLNYQPKDDDERNDDDSEQTFRKYEEELEINDFPQQARWRVTSKVSVFLSTLCRFFVVSQNKNLSIELGNCVTIVLIFYQHENDNPRI
jgi:ATP-dependent RNA helicase DDX46/PRP5